MLEKLWTGKFIFWYALNSFQSQTLLGRSNYLRTTELIARGCSWDMCIEEKTKHPADEQPTIYLGI